MKQEDIDNQPFEEIFIPHRNQLEKCIKPIHEARGVPNDYYVKPECFEMEGEHLYNKGWFAIGFVKDLPQPGAVKPVNFFKNPLMLVRSIQDQNIRVFQNVCRHRGMVLIEEPTVLKGAIRCSYHSWCYKQTGEVVATPYIEGNYDEENGIQIEKGHISVSQKPGLGIEIDEKKFSAPIFYY